MKFFCVKFISKFQTNLLHILLPYDESIMNIFIQHSEILRLIATENTYKTKACNFKKWPWFPLRVKVRKLDFVSAWNLCTIWHLQRDLLGHAIWSNRSVNCCLSYQAVLSLVLYQDVNSLTNICFSFYYMEFLFNFQRCAVWVKLVVSQFDCFFKILTKKPRFNLEGPRDTTSGK